MFIHISTETSVMASCSSGRAAGIAGKGGGALAEFNTALNRKAGGLQVMMDN